MDQPFSSASEGARVRRSESPPARRPPRWGERGFTLAELLTAVIIIGALAAAASPMFIHVARDRRVARAAGEIAGLYSSARARALGRGNAVMVRWAGAVQKIEVREALLADPARPALAPSCLGVDWEDPAESRPVADFRAGVDPYELAAVELLDESGGAQGDAELCFTPRGRAFVRYAVPGAFAPMTGVLRLRVRNTRTGLERAVLVPANGAARVLL
ncbi:MAG: prepilin-type N-terminal cleavage/methylation domain-containing protein [Polyangiaceae bacterium]|nr:prepilin-type N-terminal cleavage/methylation domain-containing protein [Polyangiaceae bacterium]